MRIISGTRRNYRLGMPPKAKLRPTTDFCKEAIFNIMALYFDFDKMEVLDLYTGSGGIAFEFASRGAKNITCVDLNPKCIHYIINENNKLNFENIDTIKGDALKFLQTTHEKYDLIFADPPYDYKYYGKLPEIVFERGLLKEKGWLILEHSRTNDFSTSPFFIECRKYGESHISIFYQKN